MDQAVFSAWRPGPAWPARGCWCTSSVGAHLAHQGVSWPPGSSHFRPGSIREAQAAPSMPRVLSVCDRTLGKMGVL